MFLLLVSKFKFVEILWSYIDLLNSRFKKYLKFDDVIIFASGVSNSKTFAKGPFQREENTLIESISLNKNKVFVYFSTCSIEDQSMNFHPYVQHKLRMEDIIQKNCKDYYIFRLPQVAGETKSPTFVKFMFDSILSKSKIFLHMYSTRNIILINDVYKIANYLIRSKTYKNETTNIASAINISVEKIINKIEQVVNQKANYSLLNKGCSQKIDISKLESLEFNLNLFNTDYLDIILYKYYNNFYKRD